MCGGVGVCGGVSRVLNLPWMILCAWLQLEATTSAVLALARPLEEAAAAEVARLEVSQAPCVSQPTLHLAHTWCTACIVGGGFY